MTSPCDKSLDKQRDRIGNEQRFLDRVVVATADGSRTIYLPSCNEHYHSWRGALQESRQIFIAYGCNTVLARGVSSLRVLEVGFGSGLNALLTWERSQTIPVQVLYTGVEAFPLPLDIAEQLRYPELLGSVAAADVFLAMHRSAWGLPLPLDTRFHLLKLQTRIEDFSPTHEYEIIYFDAFSPAVQPELWTSAVFEKLWGCLCREGVLVTYCAKGEVKRCLKAAGFVVESLPGPPGKREVTRASRR